MGGAEHAAPPFYIKSDDYKKINKNLYCKTRLCYILL